MRLYKLNENVRYRVGAIDLYNRTKPCSFWRAIMHALVSMVYKTAMDKIFIVEHLKDLIGTIYRSARLIYPEFLWYNS